MKKFNVILVYDKDFEKVLMCKRVKDPYKGKYNLVGGKIEENEDYLEAAYRELQEETGISRQDIKLKQLMDITYKMENIELQIFTGKLNKHIELIKEVNELFWFDITSNFFDCKIFAGEGNIGHMVEKSKLSYTQLYEE